MKNYFIIFSITILSVLSTVYAESGTVICNAVVKERNVSISGQLQNVNKSHQMTILVGSAEDIVYINQFPSNAEGYFNYSFPISENVAYGTYEYKVGNDAEFPVYTGVINIEPDLTVEELFLDADMRVSIDGYVPKIEGTLSCMEGKTVNFNITNTTDNTVIANDTITVDDNVYNMSYTLPSLLSTKDYSVTVSCKDGTKTLADMNINIDTAFLVVTISGTVETADNVSISAHLQTENSELLDKNTLFTGSKQISVTIPNLVSGASFLFDLEGYENIYKTATELERTVTELEVTPNQTVGFYVKAKDIYNLLSKGIRITYPSDRMILRDACTFTPEMNNTVGRIHGTGLEITEISDGTVTFIVTDEFLKKHRFRGVITGLNFDTLMAGTVEIICETIPGQEV